ncbi:TlpA family protein disulfide reductase [Solitalea lacus]|uniref:TlpA family protein disulfide reductase n=1 Tax=Solitalea lacus TaxID=2911172 RepID=UPI001EDB7834|nr:TlpA disulfide reductase family protein [Solitalea lacus]UKJ09143.1 TlpA family protein disulfide reductase [Solitalea lacus]
MKHYLLIIGIFFSINLLGQANEINPQEKFAVLKGKVKNNKEQEWSICLIGYFNNSIQTIPIDKKGCFETKIKLTDEYQDVYLYLNNEAYIQYLKPNDSLEINWDANDFTNSFEIKSKNNIRNREIQLLMGLHQEFWKDFLKLNKELYEIKSSDSVKFSKINTLYNKEINFLLKDGIIKGTSEKIACDIYFRYTSVLQSERLLPHYYLKITTPTEISNKVAVLYNKEPYKILSEWYFNQSNEYRNFIFNYIRFFRPFDIEIPDGGISEEAPNKAPFSPCWKDYYFGLANISLYEIRDWYVTKCIMLGFYYYSFNEVEAVYKDFLPRAKTKEYIDTLNAFYAKVSKLKPGNSAPVFTLKNEKGQTVSLSDFKGKAVYIDFWGVGCPPCVSDIKNHVPALHENNKNKDIVFLNICVDVDETIWKSNLDKLNLHGVNLLAEGWTRHPVCRDYGITGIPHYVLIDKDGKIVNNNAPRPYQKEELQKALDEVLAN